MIQIQENGKKHYLEPDLNPLGSNSGRENIFIKLLVRHCSKLSSYAI